MPLSLQHVHILSRDKNALAKWYCDHLGFTVTDDLEKRGEPNGPVLITADHGTTGISIFSSTRSEDYIFPAFGVDLGQFIELHAKFGKPRIYDHYRFFSFYHKDLDANRIEICCTDYDRIRAKLDEAKLEYVYMTPETYSR